MKYSIGFSRKVQTQPYENMEITLQAEFDDEQTPIEYAKDTVIEKVEGWIDTELAALGLTRPKPEAITA